MRMCPGYCCYTPSSKAKEVYVIAKNTRSIGYTYTIVIVTLMSLSNTSR